MNALEAIGKMWSIADKPERMRTFHKIVFELGLDDGDVFWHEFWRIWETSENLFEDVDFFSELIEHGLNIGDPQSALEDDEKAALAALSDPIIVYRGGIPALNEEGWSWTTDLAKAKWFAERAYGDCDRIVLKGRVKKSDVLAYLTGRSESEIVVDPTSVDEIEVEEEFTASSKGNALFYAAQTGKLDAFMGGTDMDRIRADMMATTMHGPLDAAIASLEDALTFIRWADLRSKRGYMEALLDILKQKANDPNYEPTAGFSI